MARRNDHTREELAQFILDTTFRLIRKKGYQHVSTRKIAAEIGYTVGTLYNVFTNLDNIFINVNHRIIEILLAKLHKISQEPLPPLSLLYLISEEYLTFCKEDYHLWCLLFEYRFPENQNIPQEYINKINDLYEILEMIVSRASPGCVNPSEKAAILWAGIHGICGLSFKGKFARIKLDNIQSLMEQFINGVMK